MEAQVKRAPDDDARSSYPDRASAPSIIVTAFARP
jgi:hypothetical protein